MIKRITIKRPAVLVPALAALVLMVGIALSVYTVGYGADAEEPPSEWPRLTMHYEVTGQFDKVGDASPETSTLGIRLTYHSRDNWREDIVSAPQVTTQVGTFSRQGSYQAVQNGRYVEYDSVTGETSSEPLEAGVSRIPRSMLAPAPLEKLEQGYGGEPTLTETTTRVCFNGVCRDNASGWLFVDGNRRYVYADDERGIPISLSNLNITEVQVFSDQREVVR
jgi:hypothetical protein